MLLKSLPTGIAAIRFTLSIPFFLLFFSLVPANSPLYGQELSMIVEIKADDVSAVTFDVPERRETVVLLFGPLDKGTAWFQVFLLSDQMRILRRGTRIKVDLDLSSTDNKVKHMGQHQKDGSAYVWWSFSNTFEGVVRGVRVDFASLSVSTTGGLDDKLNKEWWGGADCEGKFYMLGKEKGRKLNVYLFEESGGQFREQFIPIPDESVFADKQFSASLQKPGRAVSRKHRFFANGATICCLSDHLKGALQVTIIDPEAMTISDKLIRNPPGFRDAKAESLMVDGKIFRLLASPDECRISIQSLTDETELFSESITADMTEITMFNAPVTDVGFDRNHKVFKTIRYDSTAIQGASTFLDEINSASELYLYVDIADTVYNIRILTNNSVTYGNLGKISISVGNPASSGHVTYYTHLHALLALNKNLVKMPQQAQTAVFDPLINYSGEPNVKYLFADSVNPGDGVSYLGYPFYMIYGKRYAGSWDRKAQEYRLKRVGL